MLSDNNSGRDFLKRAAMVSITATGFTGMQTLQLLFLKPQKTGSRQRSRCLKDKIMAIVM